MLSVTHSVTTIPWCSTTIVLRNEFLWRCMPRSFRDAFHHGFSVTLHRYRFPWRCAFRCFHDPFRDTFSVMLSRCWFPWRLSMTVHRCCFPWHYPWRLFHDIPKVLHSVIANVFHYAFHHDYSVMLHKYRLPWRRSVTLRTSLFPWSFPWRLSMTLHRCCFPWHYPWRLFHGIPKVLHSVIANVFHYAFRDDYSVMLHNYRFA